jgi:hypothetical protein
MVRRFLGRIAVAATSFSGGSLFAQNLTPTTCSSGIPSIAGCPLVHPVAKFEVCNSTIAHCRAGAGGNEID